MNFSFVDKSFEKKYNNLIKSFSGSSDSDKEAREYIESFGAMIKSIRNVFLKDKKIPSEGIWADMYSKKDFLKSMAEDSWSRTLPRAIKLAKELKNNPNPKDTSSNCYNSGPGGLRIVCENIDRSIGCRKTCFYRHALDNEFIQALVDIGYLNTNGIPIVEFKKELINLKKYSDKDENDLYKLVSLPTTSVNRSSSPPSPPPPPKKEPGCYLFFTKCSNTKKWGGDRMKQHVDKTWYPEYKDINTPEKCQARRVAFSKSCSGTGSYVRM